MTDHADLINRLRSGVIEWCRITHQGHVTDNTPYEAADALEAALHTKYLYGEMLKDEKLKQERDVGELRRSYAECEAEIEELKKEKAATKAFMENEVTKKIEEQAAEIERLKNK
jgi:hypothetical protein